MALKTIPLTVEHQDLLEKRGIKAEIADRLGWQTCDGKKGDWIAIPFFRKGKQVNTKYRRINKIDGQNFEQDKGGEQCFYNLEALEALEKFSPDDLRTMPVIITEGEFDTAVALQCGYTAVSVPSGAPSTATDGDDSAKFEFVKDFPKFAIAILAVDDDPAGHILRHELALRLGWHRCKWVQYPKGCKDLNEVYAKYGQKGIDKVIKEKAKFMNSGGLFRMSELPAQPESRAYECGIGNLSDMIKPRPGDVIVVTGIPSMGKTTFVTALSCSMARLYGWDVCFGSFEQNPRGDHQRDLRKFHLGKAAQFCSDAEIADADRWIDKHFSFIVPDVNTDDLITLKWVLERARAAITQYGINMLVIDPWNELDHDRPQGMSLTEYTGIAIKEFKRLAKQYMITVIIVAHPAKMEKNKDGEIGVPTLYDISDSAHWANKSDIGIIVHRVPGEQEGTFATLIRVAKVRYWGVIGRVGDKFMEYIPDRVQYIDAPDFVAKEKRGTKKAKTELEDKHTPGTKKQAALPFKE